MYIWQQDSKMKKIVICLLLLLGGELAFAQVMGTPAMVISYSDINKPLDKIATAAGGAYSMRLLRSGYTGFCMKVRRSNDNTTQDIGFDANGNLNTSALLTFVGTNSAYVVTWYDQSGNGRNLSQATNANQPRIVNAGILDQENNKPFIRFFGITQPSTVFTSLNLAADISTTTQVIITNKFADAASNVRDGFLLGHSSTYYYWHSDAQTTPAKLIANYSASIWNATIYQNRIQKFNGHATLYPIWNTMLMVNSVAPQTPSTNTVWNCIGKDRTFHPITGGGGYSELIFFTTAITPANRELLEWSAMSYFNVL